MKTLREGAIAMIDALGVKGIWRGPDGREDTRAAKTLRTARRTARSMRLYFRTGLIPTVIQERFDVEPIVKVLSLSDTIVIAALPPDDVARRDLCWPLVDLVCQAASYTMRKAAQEPLPLVYRGAVNFGRFLFDQSSLLGPAVDEVAVVSELANGAFVWLMPRADELEPKPYRPDVWKTMAVRYSVPLKGGANITTTVITPFADTGGIEEPPRIRAGYEMAMKSHRVDVAIKRQNTMRFLDHAAQALKLKLTL